MDMLGASLALPSQAPWRKQAQDQEEEKSQVHLSGLS